MVHFEILKEFQELKGQFVITASHRIERLVAVGEDDIDYYWITFDGRDFKWNTCVGGLMPLKGHLRDEDYNELVRLAKLNHYDLISFKDFTVVFENWKNSLSKDHKFHTDFCFDLEKSYEKEKVKKETKKLKEDREVLLDMLRIRSRSRKLR